MVELKKYFDYVLSNYLLPENGSFSSQMEYYKVIVNRIPEEISKLYDNQKYKIYGSCGMGSKSASPYIAISDRNITTSTQRGIYVDFIFKSDMSGFYLTIDQGITKIKEKYGNKVAKEKAQQSAEIFRSMITDLKGFEAGLVSAHTKSGSLEEGYENTRVIAKYYEANNYTNEEILEDLKNIMNIYNEIIINMSGKSYDEIIDELDDQLNNVNKVWLYSPGENAVYWDECIDNNAIYIGWDDIGDIKKYSSEDEIYQAIKEKYNEENPIMSKCACDDFSNKMSIGDIVIAKKGVNKLLGYGTITSDYIFDPTRTHFKHTRKIKWKKIGEWINNTGTGNPIKTLTEISQYRGYPEKLLNIINEGDKVNNKSEWIIPANPKQYDHEGAFKDFGFIDWSQTRNVNVGDLVFLYWGNPEQRIFAMGKVEKVDLNADEKVDDSSYWRINASESSNKFFRLKLIKFLNDDRLSIKELEKHGLIGAPMGGQRLNDKLSEYIHSIVDNIQSTDNPIDVFRNYFLSHIEEFKSNETETERIKTREDFKQEYPISRLRTLSINEYALGTENFKETLSYYLEFGKYRYAGPGIGGATSAKHGFYKRDDGKYYGIKNKPIDNPTEYWEAFKNQMADFFEECGNIDKPLRASSKYPLLQGMNMVLTKLLYVYYPNKFINVCSKPKLRDLMKYFNYDYSNDMQAEELNFLLNKNIREDIPELSKDDPQYIGAILWKFVNELENTNEEEEVEEIVENDVVDVDSNRITGAYNKIVYGIPGCGKSYYVSNTIINNDINKGSVFRTTFYPDYTNGDFVGQVIPKLNNKDETTVLYDIQSGPFTDALLDAILNPNKNTYLIIEEINRGNAAAIFGDIFQLLDRNIEGTSEYPIKNYIISTYLHKKIDNKYSVYYDLDNIKIPSNLILIGTMNTSDQNVFTLDTAFKRRWKMEYIQNNINECIYANYKIPMSNVTWAEFVNEINDFITSDSGLDINGEDKQIGSYFITGSEWNDIITTDDSKEAARIFAEKVLSYIWEDVAKINRDSWFDSSKYRTLDSLVTAYMEKGLEVFSDNISFTREEDKD